MTSLERPLPLSVVVVILSALSVGGFAFGLKNALHDDSKDHLVSTQPLAEVSGVPIKEAQAVTEVAPPPPPVAVPKPKPTEVVDEVPDEIAPVVEPPPAAPSTTEKKPDAPPTTAPQRIEDLY